MRKTRRNTRAALGVVLGAGTVAGLSGAAGGQVAGPPPPPDQADMAWPIVAINFHNEQGDLLVDWPYWSGMTGCSIREVSWFRGVGGVAGGDGQSWVSGVSPDGRVVVGRAFGAPVPGMWPGWRGVAWTVCGGTVPMIGTSTASFGSEARGASVGGQVIAGGGSDGASVVGCRWFGRSGLDLVLDRRQGMPLHTVASGVSADGGVVCGSAFDAVWCRAFVLPGGASDAVAIGDLPGGAVWSDAAGVSGDGRVVVGRSASGAGMEAFRWSALGGMIGLGDLPGGAFHSEANAASADGSVIVGWGSGAAGVQAFRWTAAGGMGALGDLPGGDLYSQALAVSADGRVVVGTSASAHGDEAFIWDGSRGMRSLRTVLTSEYGLDLTGWTLVSATGISADGRTIVGNGYNASGQAEGWVAQLPALCQADWDGNGVVDSMDFFAFLGGFFSSSADFNHDGVTNTQDYFVFLTVFFGGC